MNEKTREKNVSRYEGYKKDLHETLNDPWITVVESEGNKKDLHETLNDWHYHEYERQEKPSFTTRLEPETQNEIRLAAKIKKITISEYIQQIHNESVSKDFNYIKYVYDTNFVVRRFKLAYFDSKLLSGRERDILDFIRFHEEYFWVKPISEDGMRKTQKYISLKYNYPKIVTIVNNYNVIEAFFDKTQQKKHKRGQVSGFDDHSSDEIHGRGLMHNRFRGEEITRNRRNFVPLDSNELNLQLTPFEEEIEKLYVYIFNILNDLRLFLIESEDIKGSTFYDALPLSFKEGHSKSPSAEQKVSSLIHSYNHIYNRINGLLSLADEKS